VIIIEYASKWWVTWPFLYYHFENDQFGQFIRNYIRTSGSMIRWLQKQYFCNVCNKCLNLRYRLVRLFPILLLHIMTVRDWKMFLPISRDLSTDKHQKVIERLSDSMMSNKSPKMKTSNQNSPNGPPRKNFDLMSISWPSDRLFWESTHWTSVFWSREARKMIEMILFWSSSKWSLAKIFWTPSMISKLMTSCAWIMLKLLKTRTSDAGLTFKKIWLVNSKRELS